MAIRPIVLYKTNEAALRCKSEPVSVGSNRTRQLVSDLKDTLLRHPKAIGLAAPQIGVHLRVVVVCFGADSREKPSPPIAIINPTIVEAGRELLDYDGCLSIPGLYAETVRPHFMRLEGLDERENPFEWTLEGFDAVVVHHEVDHLNGVLFIDRVTLPNRFYSEDEAAGVRV
ncbi:MAG: peptide deformylase [Polyangiaceae bacterium]|nr:peptide deformylase [Polyangiaceae bacterium]